MMDFREAFNRINSQPSNEGKDTGIGTFCRICDKLMPPNSDGICSSCKDAMKRNGYVRVVRCEDCKSCFQDGENVRFNVCELNHNKVQADNWFCADGIRKEQT